MLGGRLVPFGPDLLFRAEDRPDFVVHVEICEDLWVPAPPSGEGALAGATVLANLSASNITVGQGRDAQAAQPVAVGALPRGLSLCRLGRRRVDDRSRLGRPDLDLRERRHPGRNRPLPEGRPDRHRGCRPRSAAAGAGAAGHVRRQPAPPRHSPGFVSHRVVPARPARPRHRLRAAHRALPLRARRPGPARAGLLRGLQHPGLGAAAAPRGDQDDPHRHRRFGRSRLRPMR